MSKENLEQFMKQVADSEDLQAKIGKEITGDALVALGAAHGCEFSIEDVQAGAELSDAELEGVAGGLSAGQGVLVGNPTYKQVGFTSNSDGNFRFAFQGSALTTSQDFEQHRG
jgi:predicted ribosomally synthesized peptide with nif11-like leader